MMVLNRDGGIPYMETLGWAQRRAMKEQVHEKRE